MTRLIRIAVLTALLAMSTACGGNPLTGSPVPAGNEMRTPDISTQPRPREIRLDGKDPCALVPESDWGKFSIERPGQPQQNKTFNSPECYYGNLDLAVGITLVVTEGIEAWRTGKRTAEPTDAAPIQGFPTISLMRPKDMTGCDTVVDVAKGQYLLATVIVLTDDGVPKRCDWAHQLAESAMKTLVGL